MVIVLHIAAHGLSPQLLAVLFVPLHDGHQKKQNCDPAQHQRQCDIAFAAFPGPLLLIPQRQRRRGKSAGIDQLFDNQGAEQRRQVKQRNAEQPMRGGLA